jgi:hypothetical protein
MIMSFAVVYGAGRVLTDFLRVDKTWFGLGLTGSQLTAIGVILLCLFMLLRFWRKPLPESAPVVPGEGGDERGSDEDAGGGSGPPPRSSTEFTPPSEPEPRPGERGPSTESRQPTDPTSGEQQRDRPPPP